MSINRLLSKRQLNVQEQNALVRHEILKCATAYQHREPYLNWVRLSLELEGLNSEQGILINASSVICGNAVEAASALWLNAEQSFFKIEADITFNSTLISVEFVKNITAEIPVNAHNRGIGKSFGYLALEVLKDIL